MDFFFFFFGELKMYSVGVIRSFVFGLVLLLLPNLIEGRSGLFGLPEIQKEQISFHTTTPSHNHVEVLSENRKREQISCVPRGGFCCSLRSFFAGWNPFGYGLTALGKEFLEFEGSLDSDVGRFLASLKSGRKSKKTLKDQWLEVIRVSKKGQSLRVYRTLDELIAFCVKAGFIF